MGAPAMTSSMQPAVGRKWAALLAVAFCGYLTLATSETPREVCPPEQSTALERTFTRDERLRSWQLTAVSATPITRWLVQVTPAVSLTYIPPEGVEVTVVTEPIVGGLDEAGTNTSGDNTSAPVASTDLPPLPPDHVLVGDGTLTIVCGSDPGLCREAKFTVATDESTSRTFGLEAIAIRAGCVTDGSITDLRLEPTKP